MAAGRIPLPERLLAGFVPVDDPLVISRYNEALESIGAAPTELSRFRIDSAGYSPDVAAERNDPFYLGADALHAHAIIVFAAQLGAPLVQPGLGFAARAYRKLVTRSKKQISAITLHQPVVAEAHHGSARLTSDRQLADVARFELRFRTPGGHLRASRRLEEMKQEFLASDRLWLDDEFIAKMAALAREVRDLGPVSEELVASQHSLDAFYTPAFGGSYVLEERGRRTTTTVLSGDRDRRETIKRKSLRARRLELMPLEPEAVCELLLEHKVARFDYRGLRRNPQPLGRVQHWVAVQHLLSVDPERHAKLDPEGVERAMRKADDPPPDYLELADVRRRIQSDRRDVDLDRLTPLTKLRLLEPSSSRPTIQAFVRHLRAAVDPVDLELAWQDAPDLFFARLHAAREEQIRYFARWLDQTRR